MTTQTPETAKKLTRLEQLLLEKKKLEEETKAKKKQLIEDANTKKAQLEAQIRNKQNSQRKAERKLDTRRKILVGATFLSMVETGKITEAELSIALDAYLTTERDRKVFGLTGGTKPAPKAPKLGKEDSTGK